MTTGSSATALSLPSRASTFFCEHCSSTARFLNPSQAAVVAAVSRSTIYHWMGRGLVHWRLLPSGRRVICVESLSRPREIAPQVQG
jgi:hypothetical protein